MIIPMTRLKVADNCGARMVMCIGMIGQKKVARVGRIITVTVKESSEGAKVRKGTVQHAVVVRQRSPLRRKDGREVIFGDNACVLLTKDLKEPLGTRVFGPVAEELRKDWLKICSLAPRII